jgi:hypothetical protein
MTAKWRTPARRPSDAELDELARITPAQTSPLPLQPPASGGTSVFNALLDATPMDEPTAGEAPFLDGLSIPGPAR